MQEGTAGTLGSFIILVTLLLVPSRLCTPVKNEAGLPDPPPVCPILSQGGKEGVIAFVKRQADQSRAGLE